MSNLLPQIAAHLISKSLNPTQPWLSAFLETQKPTTPLPAVLQTALFRLLASDITTSLSQNPATCFPPDFRNVINKEWRLEGVIAAQVLAVEDMSKSRWEQIEAIEALERGEGTKGREIIRVAAMNDEDGQETGVQRGGGPHKLLLQDANGHKVFGIELRALEGVGLGMNLGCKVVLSRAMVARGVVLLEPATVVLLGGKIEGMHKAWKEGRKEELKAAIEASEGRPP